MVNDEEVRLPRPPGVLRRALAAHPLAVDVFIVVWYFIGCLLGLGIDFLAAAAPLDENVPGEALPSYLTSPQGIVILLGVLAVGAALLFRRRFPLAGLIVTVIVSLGDSQAISLAIGVALLFMLYAVPVYRSAAAGWLGFGIAFGASLLSLGLRSLFPATVSPDATPGEALFTAAGRTNSVGEFIAISIMTGIWYLGIVLLGINLGNRRRYLQAIIDRAHQLARERDQLAQLAVAEERSRIAREMHDIVAHSVSVMIALSEGAARAATAAPDAAADAMRRSAETGRTALAEMRRLLGALHAPEGSAELVPQPGVQDLPELVRGFVDAGLAVSLDVTGEAAGDRGQELAVYRVVQEGLTNVLRYAGVGARVKVTVLRQADRTVVQVRDYGTPPGAATPVAGLGSGRGLAGLAERVRVFGGSIESGPVDASAGGGWRLWAVLPVSADAREPTGSGGAGEPGGAAAARPRTVSESEERA
ncbi:two-component sensor histidine kinase [Leucobacter massiliensis]|uniref:histidine kinase n=2 Tax=Leucobacter massiliensis TaxID=1686285 RepID=A0A2S9QQ30_9MICO|nr:two-component sensor histidine kinase [Leucobacter massiliensis]